MKNSTGAIRTQKMNMKNNSGKGVFLVPSSRRKNPKKSNLNGVGDLRFCPYEHRSDMPADKNSAAGGVGRRISSELDLASQYVKEIPKKLNFFSIEKNIFFSPKNFTSIFEKY